MVMEVVTGVMGRLLPKLVELLEGEYKLQKGVKKDIESLKQEMKSMHTALEEVAEVPRDHLNPQFKIWADQLRELSYDMEDVVDNFLMCVEGSDPAANSNKLKWLMEKMTSYFTKANGRHQIANDIKDLKKLAEEVAARRARCKVSDVVVNPATKSKVDPRMLALYKDQQELVGIENARVELTKRLAHGDGDVLSQQLKIVSIVGPGGLGKTTLAKAVYDSLQTKYVHKAFVPVGRKPEVNKVLKDILLELGVGTNDIATLDERQLVNKLRQQLQNVRYFIVIDDIWDLESWGTIKCALLDNNRGSRVITTTRIHEVAANTGDVYKLEPLSRDLSRALFYKRLFGDKKNCPDDLLSEVSEKFLQKCGGVPLAIIAIASLLVGKHVGGWSTVYNSIGFKHGDNTHIGNMRRILLFSYDDLPCYLRPCLLHLSIFPEDALIMKETLIWMWVAEGFVSEEPERGLFEIGEEYFSDLVNRNLILPVEDKEENVIYACRVHDMVLDTICWLSKEENFVTIVDSNGKHSSSESNNVRRLAVQTRDEEQHNHLANTSMPKLRSCYASRCHKSMMPPLSSFQVLRVLDMKNCIFLENCHLKHLGKLHQLRYLSLENTYISELPKDIGDLKFLQTLDLRNSKIKELPQGTSLLRKLKRLRVDRDRRSAGTREDIGIIVPNWIGNLTSLEELYLSITGEFSTFVKELGKLKELRVLVCHFREHLNEKKALVDSVSELGKIQILHLEGLYGWSKSEADTYWKDYKPPQQLGDLSISTEFSRLPPWIKSSVLPNLSKLKIRVYPMKKRDVMSLGGLPELLKLDDHLWIPAGMEFADGAFPKLRSCGINAPFWFLPGSMHSLESITVGTMRNLTEKDAVTDFDFTCTLRNLPSLEVVFADVEKMEAALSGAIHNHPNRPFLHLRKHAEDRMTRKEPASPLHHTASVGTSAQIILEDKEAEESSSQQIAHKSHDNEASVSRKADQQPDNKANDVDVDAPQGWHDTDVDAAMGWRAAFNVPPNCPSPWSMTTNGVSAFYPAVNYNYFQDRYKEDEEEEEEESQADQQEQPAEEHEEAEDGSAETTPPDALHTVVATSLAESSDAAAATPAPPAPARPRWRRWACFSCLKSGSSSSD